MVRKTLFLLNQTTFMKFFFLFIFTTLTTISFSQKVKPVKLKKGFWVAELNLSDTDDLPFNMLVKKDKKSNLYIIYNGEEQIILNNPVQKGDSLYVKFPFFNSELVFSAKNKKSIEGYWHNYNKGANYKIPFSSVYTKDARFSFVGKRDESVNLHGKWQVDFEPNTNSTYPAVGIFNQGIDQNSISGTFLTETGDYRYLAGNCTADSLYLSCFDGSHAFLFKALYEEDTLKGKFFSGTHWQSEWQGVRNDTFNLTNPDELTYLNDSSEVNFKLKTIGGKDFSFPNHHYDNKVVIIQIMGTWCPNCLDESRYYKELYTKYNQKGLEIISIGYETGDSFEDHAKKLQLLKDKLNLNFTFLVGGRASKTLASEHFNMLNDIISFPTSIFIGRDGDVKRIHTGFNGPGTGTYYTEYMQKTNALVEYLLAE